MTFMSIMIVWKLLKTSVYVHWERKFIVSGDAYFHYLLQENVCVAVFTCERLLFWHTHLHRWIFVLLSLCVYIHKRMNPNIDAYDSSFVALVSLSATLTGSQTASSSSRKISALLGCFVVLVSSLGVEKGGNSARDIKKRKKKKNLYFKKLSKL